MAEDRDAKATDEARRAIDRVGQDSEQIGVSGIERSLRRAQAHFTAAEAPENDPAEIWGRRIGRGLAALFVAFLIWYLVRTYVLA